MGFIIGIDVGISTTKIVGLREGRVVSPIRITAADQVTSLYGAFGKYLHDNKVALSDVEQVMLTGVGAGYVDESLYGIPTRKVDEFVADGLGARFESGLSKAIVVSMGTGTSFVQCDGDVPFTLYPSSTPSLILSCRPPSRSMFISVILARI